ncbi:hypothetical protein CUR178_00389 [Leishmania enriettii]|uniref:Uncharacterized protein n=1 Tax=Leishmania enriettii TaxID=5663 RepID=A0A836GKV3_LEIEN|nr:hypothetical protein CUR178_00389 [Leishmania enriettii]
MLRYFIARSSDTAMTENSADTNVNCNHGTWNEVAHTCDCHDGWCTDWVNQDVLSGKFVYCNSQASTPSPNSTSPATTSPLVGKSTLIVAVFAIALAASCGIVVFCCYRRKRHLKKEEKQEEILAATTKDGEAWLKEGAQLQQMQAQERAALSQQAWIAQLEAERQNQMMMEQLMNMSVMTATSNPPLSKPSRHRQQHTHEILPPQLGGAPCACDTDYEGGNSLTNTFDRWRSHEPLAQSHSYYRPGATLSTTGSCTGHSEALPFHYTTAIFGAPQRGLKSPPQHAHPTNCHLPF